MDKVLLRQELSRRRVRRRGAAVRRKGWVQCSPRARAHTHTLTNTQHTHSYTHTQHTQVFPLPNSCDVPPSITSFMAGPHLPARGGGGECWVARGCRPYGPAVARQAAGCVAACRTLLAPSLPLPCRTGCGVLRRGAMSVQVPPPAAPGRLPPWPSSGQAPPWPARLPASPPRRQVRPPHPPLPPSAYPRFPNDLAHASLRARPRQPAPPPARPRGLFSRGSTGICTPPPPPLPCRRTWHGRALSPPPRATRPLPRKRPVCSCARACVVCVCVAFRVSTGGGRAAPTAGDDEPSAPVAAAPKPAAARATAAPAPAGAKRPVGAAGAPGASSASSGTWVQWD